jgi:hypothetical protein
MFDQELNIDIDQALSDIPAQYQDIFRVTLEQELRDTEELQTDTEILRYLRQRREEFKRGAFIRPDGQTGAVLLDAEQYYDQALPEIVRSTLGNGDDSAEKRRTLLKVGGLLFATLFLFIIALRGRTSRAEEDVVTPVTTTEIAAVAQPTQPIPDITGADETLKTIGGLGGALTIGRPSSLELHYLASDEVIALPIDPSKTTTKGELRYNEAAMLSDNPVAVWLFGTVLNYAIGIPDSMVRNLQPGDQITINTDTGTALSFVVTLQADAASHETGDLLSQSRTGLTLFALPALSNDAVAYAFARYDFSQEQRQSELAFALQESIALGDDATLSVTDLRFTHDATGALTAILTGTTTSDQPLLLSLLSGNEQTAVISLSVVDFIWSTPFSLSEGAIGDRLFAEFRTPANNLFTVSLGNVPDLLALLKSSVTDAIWDNAQGAAVLSVAVHNPSAGDILLPANFIRLSQGGDADDLIWQLTPMSLPTLVHSGETVTSTVTALPQFHTMRLQLGANLFDISQIPVADSRP